MEQEKQADWLWRCCEQGGAYEIVQRDKKQTEGNVTTSKWNFSESRKEPIENL